MLCAPVVGIGDSQNTVYGDFRLSLTNVDDDAPAAGDDTFRIDSNNSRIGFKGWVGSDTLKAVYVFEYGTDANDEGNNDFDSRYSFAGFKGKFGSIIYGRTSTPYKMACLKMDPFYDTPSVGPRTGGGVDFAGATYGCSDLTNSWTSDTIAYSSPDYKGATLNIATYVDDSDADKHDYNAGVQWTNSVVIAGVQYLYHHGNDGIANAGNPFVFNGEDGDAVRLYGSYKGKHEGKDWMVGLSVEHLDPDGDQDETNHMYLVGTYQLKMKLKLAASYGNVDDGITEGAGFNLGAFYEILPKTQIYGVFSNYNADSDVDDDRQTFALGVSHKFASGG